MPVRVVVDLLARRRPGACRRAAGPGRTARSAGYAVVDEQERAPRPRPAAASATQSSSARQISARLAVAQLDALVGEPRGEGRGRRVDLDLDEATLASSADGELAQLPAALPYAMDRQRVEDLVGQDDRRSTGAGGPSRLRARREPGRRPAAGRTRRAAADRRRSARSAIASRPADRGRSASSIGDRERAGAGAVLADRRTAPAGRGAPRPRQQRRQRRAEDRMELRRRDEVAGPARPGRRGPVVAAVRVVQRELHEPGERHRSVARDLVADPRGERLVLADVVRSAGRARGAARASGSIGRPPRVARPTQRGGCPARPACARRAGPGSARRGRDAVSARSHGSSIRSGSSRSDAKRSSGGGQAASSAPRRWASSTRVSRPPRRRGARGARRATPARRGRAAGRGPRPAARWPAPRDVRRPRSSTSARVREAVRRPARQGRRRRPAGDDAAPPPGPRHARGRAAEAIAAPGPRSTPVAARRTAPSQDDVERPVDIDRQAPAAAQVARRVAAPRRSQRGRALSRGEVRQVGEDRRSRGDGHDVGRVAVVGERAPVVGAAACHQVAPVRRRRQRDRPGAQDHEPGRAPARTSVAQPRPERCIVRRAGDDPDVAAPGRPEPAAWRSAQRRGRRRPSARAARRRPVGWRMRTVTGRTTASLAVDRVRRRGRTTGPGVHRARARTSATPRRRWPTRWRPGRAARALGCAASPGCTRRNPSAWPTSPSSATRSSPLEVPGRPDPEVGALALLVGLKEIERRSGASARLAGGRASSTSTCSCSAGRASRSSGRPRRRPSTPLSTRRGGAAARGARTARRASGCSSSRRSPTSRPGLVPPGWGETVDTARRRREAIEGADAVGPIGTWDPHGAVWRPADATLRP